MIFAGNPSENLKKNTESSLENKSLITGAPKPVNPYYSKQARHGRISTGRMHI